MKKYLLSLVALLMCVVASAQVTFTAPEGWTSTAGAQTFTKDGVTISTTKGVGSTQYRIYKGETFTVSSTVGDIIGVEITATANDDAQYGPGCFTDPTTGSYSFSGKVGTWTGKAATVSLTASSNQVRATKIVVTISDDESAVKVPVFTPAEGTYYGAAYVYATCETEGATIKYALNDGEWAEWPAGFDAEHPAGVLISETSTLKAKAVKGEDESRVVSATYTIGKEYANLAELVNVEPEGQPVRVTLYNVAINSIYVTSSGYRNGIYVNSGNEVKPEVEIFCYNVPEEWVAGGTVSGTIEGTWKKYGDTWEVCPANWDGLTYTAPAAYATVNVDDASKVRFSSESDDYTLVNGSQKFSAGQYMIGTTVAGYKLASVKKNNETVAPVTGAAYWMVELAADDVLDITANYEDESYAIIANDLAAIKSVTTLFGGGVDITEQVTPAGFDEDDNATAYAWAAPAGYMVNVVLNDGYTSESALNFYATEDVEIVTAAQNLATVNIDNATRVKIQNTNYEVLAVVDGAQKLSAGEYMVMPTGDFMLAEVKLNNEVLNPQYGTAYYVELAAGDVLDVTANWLDEDGEQAVSYIYVNDIQAIKAVTFAGVDCTEQVMPGGFDEDDNVTSYVYGAPKGEKVIITLNEGYETTSTLAFYAVEDEYEINAEKLTNLVIAEGGVVGSIKSFTIKARNAGEPIMSSSSEDVILVNKATREVVYTWAAEDLDDYATDIDYETYYMPTAYVLTLDEEITTPGTYALVVPAGAFYVGEDMVDSDAASTEVTIEGTAQTGLYLESYELDSKGGSLIYSMDVAFGNQSYMDYVDVLDATTNEVATQATLTYDAVLYNKILVEFQNQLAAGAYILDIPANTVIGNDNGDEYAGDKIKFTVEANDNPADAVLAATLAGEWFENTSGWYYGDDWVTFAIEDSHVTATAEGNQVTFTGLLGNSKNSLVATVNAADNTLTFAMGQTAYYDGYDWSFGGEADDESMIDLVATINEDGSITLNNVGIFYYGYNYMWNAVCTLTRVATGINTVDVKNTANGKYLENGKIVIVRNGKKYNVNGTVIE